MSYVGEARFRFKGPADLCSRYIPIARVLVERTVAMFDVRTNGGSEAATHTTVLSDGAVIKVTVFDRVPPIITITPVLVEEKTVRKDYDFCLPGLVIEEALDGELNTGPEIATSPVTLIRKEEGAVQLSSNRLIDGREYPRVPWRNTQGSMVLPVFTPAGKSILSGDAGLACPEVLYQAGFIWSVTEGVDVKWRRAMLQATYNTTAYNDPAFAFLSAVGRPRIGHTPLAELSVEENFIAIRVDQWAMLKPKVSGRYAEPESGPLVYHIPSGGYEPLQEGVEAYAPLVCTGSLYMQNQAADYVEFAVIDLGMTRRESVPPGCSFQTGTLRLNRDGTYELKNGFNPLTTRILSSITATQPRFYDPIVSGLPTSDGSGFILQHGSIPSADVFIDRRVVKEVGTLTTNPDGSSTASVTRSVIDAPRGMDLTSQSGELYFPVQDGGFIGRLSVVQWTQGGNPATTTYFALPTTNTAYGECSVKVDSTTESVVSYDFSSTGTFTGTADWDVDGNLTGSSSSGDNHTATAMKISITTTNIITVVAFGHTHTLTSVEEKILYRVTAVEYVKEPDSPGATKQPTNRPFSFFKYEHYTPTGVFKNPPDAPDRSWRWSGHPDEGWSVAQHTFDGVLVDILGMINNIPHPATGAVFSNPIGSTNWEYAQTGTANRPVVGVWVQGGILHLEYVFKDCRVEATTRKAAYNNGSSTDTYFCVRYAFTSDGRKTRVEPRDKLDPEGNDIPVDISYNPETSQLYAMHLGDVTGCFVESISPRVYDLPVGWRTKD